MAWVVGIGIFFFLLFVFPRAVIGLIVLCGVVIGGYILWTEMENDERARKRATISITVTHDSASLQVHSPGHSIRTAATGDNLSVTLHGSQPLTQGVEVPILIQRQLPCNRLQPKRCVGRFQ